MKTALNKYILCTVSILVLSVSSCKNYLDIEPIDRLTGNNYFLSADDVESNIAFMYDKFFEKINETWVIGAIGEARSGEIFIAPGANSETSRKVIEVLGKNDLLSAINDENYDWYNIKEITKWKKYYQVIQSTNILLEKLKEGIPGVEGELKERYIAETKFIRSFTYFWMVRLYGDVVYYTENYHAKPLAREDMVKVLNSCIEDLSPHKDKVAWSFSDPSLRGVRPARGAIIALLMHMNMWNATFDEKNKDKYLKETVQLGDELIKSGQHTLYPLNEEDWAIVTKGRSKESLFEFYRSINNGDNVGALAPFWDHFLRWPYKFPRNTNRISHAYFISTYMNRIYPESVADKRRELWFEDIDSDNGDFVLKKYGTNVYASGNEDKNPDNTFMIFRYSGILLLHAEAAAEMDETEKAIKSLNMVRNRAEATPYSGGGGKELKDFVFMERNRELIGEGHKYFDLIRTKRILNPEWTMNPLSRDQFNRRAWTWPIDRSALQYNPNMELNEYWLTIGR